MKYLAAILAAMGISTVAFADGMDPIPGAQSYGAAPADVYVVHEYVVVPADAVVLVPVQPDQDQSDSHIPG